MATNSLTALITGGTSGIGRAAANKLAQLGIHIIVVGRNAQRGDTTVTEIRAAGGEADFVASDLRDAARARSGQKSDRARERTCRYSDQQRWDLPIWADA